MKKYILAITSALFLAIGPLWLYAKPLSMVFSLQSASPPAQTIDHVQASPSAIKSNQATVVTVSAQVGVSAALFDFVAWNAAYHLWDYRIPYALLTIVSSTVIAGAGSWALVRALAPTGVLDRFGAGRERALV